MDVVPNAGAVRCVVVRTIDGNGIPFAVGDLQNQRDQVAFRIVRLSDGTAGICTASVEIPQRNIPQTMCFGSPVEHLLHGKFGFPVRVCGTSPVALQNRNILRLAVGSSSGGKDDLIQTMAYHCLKEYLCSTKVIVVVFQRIGNTLSHQRKCCKVNHGIDFFRIEQLIQKGSIPDVALVEFRLLGNSAAVPCHQIVCDNDLMAGSYQLQCGMRTDVSGSS